MTPCSIAFKKAMMKIIEPASKLEEALERLPANQKFSSEQLVNYLKGKQVPENEIRLSKVADFEGTEDMKYIKTNLADKEYPHRIEPVGLDEDSYSKYTFGGTEADNYRVTSQGLKTLANDFKVPTAHFEEVDNTASLLWTRSHTMVFEGKPVTVLDEFQSDWMQAERSVGMGGDLFKSTTTEKTLANFKVAEDKLIKADPDLMPPIDYAILEKSYQRAKDLIDIAKKRDDYLIKDQLKAEGKKYYDEYLDKKIDIKAKLQAKADKFGGTVKEGSPYGKYSAIKYHLDLSETPSIKSKRKFLDEDIADLTRELEEAREIYSKLPDRTEVKYEQNNYIGRLEEELEAAFEGRDELFEYSYFRAEDLFPDEVTKLVELNRNAAEYNERIGAASIRKVIDDYPLNPKQMVRLGVVQGIRDMVFNKTNNLIIPIERQLEDYKGATGVNTFYRNAEPEIKRVVNTLKEQGWDIEYKYNKGSGVGEEFNKLAVEANKATASRKAYISVEQNSLSFASTNMEQREHFEIILNKKPKKPAKWYNYGLLGAVGLGEFANRLREENEKL